VTAETGPVAAAEAVLAAHGWEFSDGLEYIFCDCGWTIDAYIDYEDGLAERVTTSGLGDGGRELAAVIRHRAHLAAALAAAGLLADPAATDTTPSKSRQTVNSASSRTRVAVRGTTEPEATS